MVDFCKYFYYDESSPTCLRYIKNDKPVTVCQNSQVYAEKKRYPLYKVILYVCGIFIDFKMDSTFLIDEYSKPTVDNIKIYTYGYKLICMKKLKEMKWNEIFSYKDGELFWKIDLFKSVNYSCRSSKVGDPVKYYTYPHGHKRLCFNLDKMYNFFVHRVIYEMFNGQGCLIDAEVDHLDGDPSNNRIENLRKVDRATNGRNQRLSTKNKTGVVGVQFCTSRNAYIAFISDENSNQIKKRFSIKKYGKNEAFQMAVSWRLDKQEEINNVLGENGYTDRHGKQEEV